MALPSKSRLSNSSGVKKVFKRGKNISSELFQIKFIPAEAGVSKFAFIVGLKVSKKAVARNRLRRKLSEIIRLNISKIRQGFFIVIMAKPKTVGREYRYLEKDLMDALSRINQ